MWSFLLLTLAASVADSARILGFCTAPSYSHQITFQPIWRELSLRGHQVTVITPNPINDKSLVNLTEIDIGEVSYGVWNKYNISSLGVKSEVKSTDLSRFFELFTELLRVQLSHPGVQRIIKNENNDHYDLVVVEFSGIQTYPLKDVYKCPYVGITSLPFGMQQNSALGNPQHPILYPDFNTEVSRNMGFTDRLQSVFFETVGKQLMRMSVPKIEAIIREFYGPNTRSMDELAPEVSLILANSNPLLHIPRPNVPAAIEFSGMHIRPEKPLPKDLKKFLDDATQGVVYMSFGSNIKSIEMPDHKIQSIMSAFSELPYKVLWKFEAGTLPGKPDNMEVRKWFPQQDVLRHPNVKLFITQGGLQSLDEAMYSKTPVVVIPFFADQFGNARKAVDIGMGKSIRFTQLTKENLKQVVQEIITSKYYKDKAEEHYNIVTDQPMTALEKCVYWIEYVIRHKGAAHLRSPALDIPLYQFYLLDVIGFVLMIISLVLLVTYAIVRKVKSFLTSKLKQS